MADYVDERDIKDASEEPDFSDLMELQETYEELLKDVDRYQFSANVDDDPEDERRADILEEEAAYVGAELRVELEDLDISSFMLEDGTSSDPDDYRDAIVDTYQPQIDFLKNQFEAAEEYRNDLRERFY